MIRFLNGCQRLTIFKVPASLGEVILVVLSEISLTLLASMGAVKGLDQSTFSSPAKRCW